MFASLLTIIYSGQNTNLSCIRRFSRFLRVGRVAIRNKLGRKYSILKGLFTNTR